MFQNSCRYFVNMPGTLATFYSFLKTYFHFQDAVCTKQQSLFMKHIFGICCHIARLYQIDYTFNAIPIVSTPPFQDYIDHPIVLLL